MRYLFFFIVIVAAAGAAGWYYVNHYDRVQGPNGPKLLGKLETRERIVEKVSAVGRLAPKDRTIVTIDVPIGRIVHIYPEAEVGKMVTKGQPLLRLDDDLVQAKLDEARVAVALAEASKVQASASLEKARAGEVRARELLALAEVERKRVLERPEVTTQGDKDKAEQGVREANAHLRLMLAQVTEAESAIKTAEANYDKAMAGQRTANRFLEQLTIRAPIEGLILDRNHAVVLGATISPQVTPLFVIMPNPQAWEVLAQVGEGDITQIKVGQAARFTLEAYSGEGVTFTGRVVRIADVPSTTTMRMPSGLEMSPGFLGPANYTVTIDVDYQSETVGQHPLKAGLTANVDITTREVEQVLAVPNVALQFRPDPMSNEDQQRLDDSSNQGFAPLWIWQNKEMKLVFMRRGASDGAWTQVLPLDGAEWAKEGKEVVIEGPPVAEPTTFFGAKGITLR
ncbi:MAG TPA: efflux RND transporter periplasmic adaptor subunit [Gemmatales bacterium]|nr:efflux RND transporter periplasmic adaptor subunit [Gemmatales bacterium]HMP58080.1 efflux RND transporter periplasmic adaptor subunit [Gemmatales bacterium]